MRILYIGHYNPGSTSGMRGEILRQLLQPEVFLVINIDVPLAQTTRLFRSIGWRFKIGPLIKNINNYILRSLNGDYTYDLVWVDKGVFVEPEILRQLKRDSKKLIHFTPDPAFAYHRSKLFYEAINLYDFCITTKSYELSDYRQHGVNTIFCTQGFDAGMHKPYYKFEEKYGTVFIGHREEERESVIAKLLDAGVPVTIAGNHWKNFVFKHRSNKNLVYKGVGVFGEQYAREISKAYMAFGFLSKWVPELHTTRTFEIPACGTALVTESNQEIREVFSNEKAIFYTSSDDIVEQVTYYLSHTSELEKITEAGYEAVRSGGYSYVDIIKKILKQIGE